MTGPLKVLLVGVESVDECASTVLQSEGVSMVVIHLQEARGRKTSQSAGWFRSTSRDGWTDLGKEEVGVRVEGDVGSGDDTESVELGAKSLLAERELEKEARNKGQLASSCENGGRELT